MSSTQQKSLTFKNRSRKTAVICFLFSVLCLLSSAAFGDTHNAASCAAADVQAAVNAASDGDTVMVPPGISTWTTTIVSFSNKGITVKGAGIGQTTIIDGTDITRDHEPFVITGAEGKPFRITGFSFLGTGPADIPGQFTTIKITGNCKNWRVDHCYFTNLNSGVGMPYDWPVAFTYGLIDHCTFYFTDRAGCPIFIGCDDGEAWNRPLTMGTSNATYVEDCVIRFVPGSNGGNLPAIHSQNGARFVVRHCTINGNIEVYGCTNGGHNPVSSEIYDNQFYWGAWTCIDAGGGTGVRFNNTFTPADGGDWVSTLMQIFDYRTCGSGCCCGLNSRCDGTSSLDGNLPGMQGYPCWEQPGRGPGFELVSGTTVQKSEPFYQWNNKRNGSTVNFSYHGTCSNPSQQDHIKAGRDYYDCTSYADAQSKGLVYTPYTYPHPAICSLWGDCGAIDTSSPTAPGTVYDGPSTGVDADMTFSTTTLSANWTASSDPDSGISGYKYAIGTTAGGTNVVDWTALGNVTAVTKIGLSLTKGTTYYFSVKAINGS